jgi:hypothetical protein
MLIVVDFGKSIVEALTAGVVGVTELAGLLKAFELTEEPL